MRLYPLAYLAALLPLVTINLCYLLAASHGHVDWCFPYIDSCTSISAAGRKPPEFFVFKGLMIPSAVLLLLYWLAGERWLAILAGTPQQRFHTLIILACVASVGLVLYSVMLGAIGDTYRFQRRIGVILFFGLSYFAQLLVNNRLSRIDIIQRNHRRLYRTLTVLSVLVLLMGLASVIWQVFDEDYYDTKEDAFEWTFTLLLCLHVLVTARLWQLTGYHTRFATALNDS